MSTQTLGQAIRAAHDAVSEARAKVAVAEAERARLLRAARKEGVSVRTLAVVLEDVSPQTVWNWSGQSLGEGDLRLHGARRLNGSVPE